jgi:hypothetical protein
MNDIETPNTPFVFNVDNTYFPPQCPALGTESWPKYSGYFLKTQFKALFSTSYPNKYMTIRFNFKRIGVTQTIILKTFWSNNFFRSGLEKACLKYGINYIKPCYDQYEINYIPTTNIETTIMLEVRSDIDPKVKLFQLTNGSNQFETPRYVFIILGVVFSVISIVCCILGLCGVVIGIVLSLILFVVKIGWSLNSMK